MVYSLAQHTALTPADVQKFMGFSVGFDTVFDRLFNMDHTHNTGYPPYNIRKVNDFQYVVEMAIAGFSKDDVEVEVADGVLTVRTLDEKTPETENNTYVHRGIARRTFLKKFNLSDDIVVKGADLKDGLLSVNLERVIPEEKRPRLIPIGTNSV